MFKSITHYNLKNDTNGKTISGKGMITISYLTNGNGSLIIDGSSSQPVSGGCYLFSESVKIATSDKINSYFECNIGLFN